MPFLKEMRSGFEMNAGLPKRTHLSGRLLELLAQGTSEMTVEQLRPVASWDNVPGD
jgi:hypothetical protein